MTAQSRELLVQPPSWLREEGQAKEGAEGYPLHSRTLPGGCDHQHKTFYPRHMVVAGDGRSIFFRSVVADKVHTFL